MVDSELSVGGSSHKEKGLSLPDLDLRDVTSDVSVADTVIHVDEGERMRVIKRELADGVGIPGADVVEEDKAGVSGTKDNNSDGVFIRGMRGFVKKYPRVGKSLYGLGVALMGLATPALGMDMGSTRAGADSAVVDTERQELRGQMQEYMDRIGFFKALGYDVRIERGLAGSAFESDKLGVSGFLIEESSRDSENSLSIYDTKNPLE